MRPLGARRAAVVCGALAVLGGILVAGCTDGVTPDCSDAATQCGPNVDGSADTSDASIVPDASRPDASSDANSATDAVADADASDGD